MTGMKPVPNMRGKKALDRGCKCCVFLDHRDEILSGLAKREMNQEVAAITIEAGTDETRSGSAVGESVAIAQNKSERG